MYPVFKLHFGVGIVMCVQHSKLHKGQETSNKINNGLSCGGTKVGGECHIFSNKDQRGSMIVQNELGLRPNEVVVKSKHGI